MYNKRDNFIVGLVVLVALIIVIFGIHFLKNTQPGEKKDSYHVLFEKVSTLAQGDPVKMNGVSMGRVKYIELHHNKVLVTITLKRMFKDQKGREIPIRIPRDSRIRVQNIGLMGERQIEIQLGSSQEVYRPGEIIENGLFDAGIAETMGMAGQVFAESEKLVLALRDVVDSTVGKKEFVTTTWELIRTAESVSKQMADLVEKADPRIQRSLSRLDNATLELEKMMLPEDAPVKKLVNSSLALSEKANILMEKVDKISAEMLSITQKIQSKESALGAMLQDTLFYGNLKSTLKNADSLLTIIRKRGLDVNVDFF